MQSVSLQERYEGCLLGLACGDALGAPVEFRARGSFAPVSEMIAGGKFQLKKGQWTDDTSMALCLATSLLECNGFDPVDQLERYFQWMTTGYFSSSDHAFGIGKTVFNALASYNKNKRPYCGNTSPNTAGNGSLMRLGPVPLFYYPDKELVLEFSEQSSRTTHGAAECLHVNKIFGSMLFDALNGESKERILFFWERDYKEFSQALRLIMLGEYRDKKEQDIQSTGYVVHTLEAALWCFWKTDCLADALIMAVNLGGDADTVGAVCGQLAGAFYGVMAIPEEWLSDLYSKEVLQDIAISLYGKVRW